ncbi:MAG: T9SS type A sorting domain-containing protein [Rhodothermales bacterium]
MRIGIATIFLFLWMQLPGAYLPGGHFSGIQEAVAQKQLISTVDFEEALVYYRPRISIAENGDYAVSWEALRKLESREEWQIGLQRYTAGSTRIGSSQYLQQSAVCNQQSPTFSDLPHVDFEGGLRNAELEFSQKGLLVVSMEQFQLFQEDGKDAHRQMSSARVSVLNEQGEEYQPAAENICEWREFNAGDAEMAPMPRIDLSLSDDIMLGTDGRDLNVKPTLNAPGKYWEYEMSQSLLQFDGHRQIRNWMDVATNGWVNVTSSQRCTASEDASFGNHDVEKVDDCDVEVQFFSDLTATNDEKAVRKLVVNQNDGAGVLNYRPAVAMNTAGNSVVVWVDFRENDQGDIYGQRFDALGRPLGDNFKVSAGSGAIDSDDGSRPEVAMLDDGQFLVVWTAHHDDGMRAWGRYFGAAGEAMANPFLLDPDPTLDSGFPDVSSNGDQFGYVWLIDHQNVTSVFANIPGITNTVDRAVPIDDPSLLLKGYPNPFTSETTLEYSLQESGHVTLAIYDLLGREVKKLIDQPQGPGSYSIQLAAGELAAGYYVTRLQQGELRQSQVLVRTE